MKIDTLILSGGGPGGIAYPTIFKALYEYSILTPQLSGIKDIIVTSAGIVMAYCLLLHMNNDTIHDFICRFDLSVSLQLEDISVDGLLFEGGLFETHMIQALFKSITNHILHRDDISLLELYEHTKIALHVKVFNITDRLYEFISHKNHPELSIITLAQMTTSIPIVFKPISYNGKMYCDGGIRNAYPYGYLPSPNYLGIKLQSNITHIKDNLPLIDYLLQILQGEETTHPHDPRVINVHTNTGLDFDMSDSKKQKLFETTYHNVSTHITQYLLETDKTDETISTTPSLQEHSL